MFCIIYALVGIPILLIFMAKIGDMMAGAFRWMYRLYPYNISDRTSMFAMFLRNKCWGKMTIIFRKNILKIITLVVFTFPFQPDLLPLVPRPAP
jgi:hypothetical protein